MKVMYFIFLSQVLFDKSVIIFIFIKIQCLFEQITPFLYDFMTILLRIKHVPYPIIYIDITVQ